MRRRILTTQWQEHGVKPTREFPRLFKLGQAVLTELRLLVEKSK